MADFTNPYTILRQALEKRQRELADEPIPPMLSEQESEDRRSKLSRNRMYGEMGLMSRDPGITAVAKPLLEETIKASALKQTEHGEYDPTTGSLREFPSYRRNRQVELTDKQLQSTGALEAGAQARYDEARRHAQEALERQRERQDADRALRLTLKGMHSGGDSDKGSVTYVGTDEKGQPVMNHSKGGLFQPGPDGSRVPYGGKVHQKDTGITAGEREKAVSSIEAYEGFDTAIKQLDKVKDDKRTKLTTGILPGALASSGKVGQALVQGARSKEYNDAFQRIANISDGLRAGRFGLTLTPMEQASSMRYLPSDLDSPQDLIDKAQGLKSIIENRYRIARDVQNQGGFGPKVPELKTTDSGGDDAKGPYADPEKNKRYNEYKRKNP